MERDRGGHRGVKRSSQFGCKSCHVSHPAFAGVRCGRESVASRSFGEEFRGERTPSSRPSIRERESSRARRTRRGATKKKGREGKKKQERGKYRQKTVKAQLRGQNAGEKKEQQVGEKNIAARRAVAKNARLPEGTGR